MILSRLRAILFRITAAAALLAVVGCAQQPEASRPRVNRDPNLLLIYAACGVASMIDAAQTAFVSQNPGKSVDVMLDEPSKLAEKIRKGDVPDIVVCLGGTEIGSLEGEGLLDGASRQAFGSVRVILMVPKGNPTQIRKPDDLLMPEVKIIAIAIPGLTSAGTDAKRELDRLRLWSKLQEKLFFTESALAALRAVSESKVDAALLYDPCLD